MVRCAFDLLRVVSIVEPLTMDGRSVTDDQTKTFALRRRNRRFCEVRDLIEKV
jgi:hypothetical protein